MSDILTPFRKKCLSITHTLALNKYSQCLINSFASPLKRKRELNFNSGIAVNDTESISLKLAFKSDLFSLSIKSKLTCLGFSL